MSTPGKPSQLVFCRRVKRELPVTEHVNCPYCFGKGAEVSTNQHETFCDYQEGKDPVNFGFPATHGRYGTDTLDPEPGPPEESDGG